MTTVALVVAGISLICSGVSVVAVLVLLGRKEFAYATKADLERLADEVTYKSQRTSCAWHLGARPGLQGCPPMTTPGPRDGTSGAMLLCVRITRATRNVRPSLYTLRESSPCGES
jgi:hypothetical protein